MSAKTEHSAKTLWELVRPYAGPYKPAAFTFVQDGLRFTCDTLLDRDDNDDLPHSQHHVSGQQLCIGLRRYAIEQFGHLARTVLATWGIHRTDDFGRIVYALLDAGVLRKSASDSIDDFTGVYDFAEAFGDVLERARR